MVEVFGQEFTEKEIQKLIDSRKIPMDEDTERIKAYLLKKQKCSEECLVCATFFEFNITGEEFRKSYMDHGGSEVLADHMWGKFDGYKHSILKLMGSADYANRKLITDVVNDWCKTHPKDIKR